MNSGKNGNELITTTEAGSELGITRRHVDRLIAAGALPAVEVGNGRKVRRADVETFKQTRTRLHTLEELQAEIKGAEAIQGGEIDGQPCDLRIILSKKRNHVLDDFCSGMVIVRDDYQAQVGRTFSGGRFIYVVALKVKDEVKNDDTKAGGV